MNRSRGGEKRRQSASSAPAPTEARLHGEQIEGSLPNAPGKNELLNAYLAAAGVPEDARPALSAKIRQMVAPVRRVLWVDKADHEELKHLNAPRFLRTVYADLIDEQGRLTNDEEVRLADPKLVQVVQGYIAQREKRSLGLGDAKGLVFARKDARGRPKTPQLRKSGRRSPPRRA